MAEAYFLMSLIMKKPKEVWTFECNHSTDEFSTMYASAWSNLPLGSSFWGSLAIELILLESHASQQSLFSGTMGVAKYSFAKHS